MDFLWPLLLDMIASSSWRSERKYIEMDIYYNAITHLHQTSLTKQRKSWITPANSSAVSVHRVCVCVCVAQMSSLSRCHHVIAHKHSNRAACGVPLAHNCRHTSQLAHLCFDKGWWYHLITFNYLPFSLFCRSCNMFLVFVKNQN